MLFVGKWTEVEIIMLSEISQAQKDKYFIFSHMQDLDLKRINNMTYMKKKVL
jgi:hypothetical protein